MELDYILIGERMKKARQDKGYSQLQLSEILNISDVYLKRLEKGKTRVSLSKLAQICDVLDVSVCEILTGVAKKSKEYMYKDIIEVLDKCTPEKRRLIYHMATLVANIKSKNE